MAGVFVDDAVLRSIYKSSDLPKHTQFRHIVVKELIGHWRPAQARGHYNRFAFGPPGVGFIFSYPQYRSSML